MCGILGAFVAQRALDVSALTEATRLLGHRGPDDEGYVMVSSGRGEWAEFWGERSLEAVRTRMEPVARAQEWARRSSADVALGHRRLSIIDLSERGHQPFWDAERRACLIINGEIYNYLEVRRELQAASVEFRTETDTEVLLAAYLRWGEDCFARLNGMWALAIYDFQRRALILSRDRAGERPLYWLRSGGDFFFASELRALSRLAGVEFEASDKAAATFLATGLSDLNGETFYRGMRMVPAASVVRVALDKPDRTDAFWRLPPRTAELRDERAAADELRVLLRDSIKLRLRADVPVTVSLSGGLDSSSIVALAAEQRIDAPLDTYTVRFNEAEWDEWPFAQAVVQKFGTRNTLIEPPSAWPYSHLPEFVEAMEEPVHAPDLLPDYVIRKELARQGFKVGLSGIGGDELFAGYEHYRWLRVHDLQRSGHRLRALGEIVLSSQTSPPAALWRLLRSRLPRVRPATDLYRDAVGPPSEGVTPPDNCEDRLRADLEWALLPYWLRAGDKSCMAAPIEVRYPFLDHRLLEFSTRLPVVHLIRRGWLKWLLRTAMEGTLPRSVTWRRKKMGFPFPIKSWLLEERSRLRQVFGESDNPWIDRRFWLHRLAEAIDADPWLVWRAFSLELWHRRFIRRVSVFPEAVDAA